VALIEPLDWPDRTLVVVAVSEIISFGQLRLNLAFANDLEFQKTYSKKLSLFSTLLPRISAGVIGSTLMLSRTERSEPILIRSASRPSNCGVGKELFRIIGNEKMKVSRVFWVFKNGYRIFFRN
jgi:hypothetical protein